MIKIKCELYSTLIRLDIAKVSYEYSVLRLNMMLVENYGSPSKLFINHATFNNLQTMLNSKT